MTDNHRTKRRGARPGLHLVLGAIALMAVPALGAEPEEPTPQPCPPGYRVCGSGCCPA